MKAFNKRKKPKHFRKNKNRIIDYEKAIKKMISLNSAIKNFYNKIDRIDESKEIKITIEMLKTD